MLTGEQYGSFGMIDWLTLKLPLVGLDGPTFEAICAGVADKAGRVVKIDSDGVVEWERVVWDRVRSDVGSVLCRIGDGLEIMGSPARAVGSENVFGTGDICQAARSMLALVSSSLGVELPADLRRYRVTRADVTHSYDLGGAAECRAALDFLRYGEGGRYRGQGIGSTLYWGQKSAHWSGKAYHKGQHLRFLAKREGIELEPWQFEAADRLLRLELSLRRHWWDRCGREWWTFEEAELEEVHARYFKPLIGDIKVTDMNTDILKELEKVAGSPGKALAAFRTWSLVKVVGVEQARASMPVSTWTRHRRAMLDAGLSLADLRAGNVLPFRRKTIVLGNPVRSWDELRAA